MSANPAPGFKKRPEHRITTQPARIRVCVSANAEIVADTRDALAMKEGDYAFV